MKFDPNVDFCSFYKRRDQFSWSEIEKLKAILKNYTDFTQLKDLPQLLRYDDLLKKVYRLPGSTVEVVIFLWNILFTWTKLLENLFLGNRGRKILDFYVPAKILN